MGDILDSAIEISPINVDGGTFGTMDGEHAGTGHGGEYLGSILEPRMGNILDCLLYTSPSPRDRNVSRMPSSA